MRPPHRREKVLTSSMTVTRSPLSGDSLCQNCGYNLRELPPRHTCPECGLAYDPHMMIIELGGPRGVFPRRSFLGSCPDVISVVMLQGLAFYIVAMARNEGYEIDRAIDDTIGFLRLNSVLGDVDHDVLIALVVLIPLLVLIIIRAWFRFISRVGLPRRLILNHEGVQFDHPGIELKTIPWSDIKLARYRWWTGWFKIKGHWITLFKCPFQQLGGRGRARHCAAEINRLQHIYISAQE